MVCNINELLSNYENLEFNLQLALVLWHYLDRVVWPPEPLKVKCFLQMFKNAEKWAKSASSKTGLFGHFFSKCCHSKTNKDIDMKPKLVEA